MRLATLISVVYLLVFSQKNVQSQCSLGFSSNDTILSSISKISCGDSLELIALGSTSSQVIFDSVNQSNIHPIWDLDMDYTVIPNGGYDSVCLSPHPPVISSLCGSILDNTTCYVMGNINSFSSYHHRSAYLVTYPMDYSCGGNICFDLKMIDSSFANFAACDATATNAFSVNNIPHGLGGIALTVSSDNINWDTLGVFNDEILFVPSSSPYVHLSTPLSDYYGGQRYCFTLPPNLYSSNLRIRIQRINCEHYGDWLIDNIELAPNDCNYYYDWSHIPGSPNNNSVSVAPQDTTTYTVLYTNGIDDTCSASVTVNVPQFNVNLSPTIDSLGCNDCLPIQVTLPDVDSVDQSNFIFNWSPSLLLNSLQGDSVVACLDSINQSFYVTVTDTISGCFSEDSVTVLVNHCGCEYINHSVILDSCQTGGTYSLSGQISFYDFPGSGNLIITAQTNTSNYTDTLFQNFVEDSVYMYFINGIPQSGGQLSIIAHFEDEITCADTLVFQAPDLPEYTILQGSNAYCFGASVNDILLNVDVDQNATLYYSLNGNPQSININTGQINLGNQEGEYIIDSIVDVNCSQVFEDTLSIIIYALPNVNAGLDSSLCLGESYALIASGVQSYQWENGFINQQIITPNLGVHQYIVEGTDSIGCTNKDTVNITVNALPQVSFNADTLFGCEPLEVEFTNTTSNTQSLLWNIDNSTFSTQPISYAFSAGLYSITLEITDLNDCINDTSFIDYVEVYPNPIADFSMSSNEISTLDNAVEFTNESSGATSYLWIFGDGDSSNLSNPTHSYDANSRIIFQVELYATSADGCTDVFTQSIDLQPELLYYVPNTFTPNGDNANNTFKPIFTSGIDFTSYQLEIYNRTGTLIFTTQDLQESWDGTFKGNPVPDGVYSYKIYFTSSANAEREFITGHVNVLR